MTTLSELLELNKLAQSEGAKCKKKRFLSERLNPTEGRHAFGICGPRGVGKTILIFSHTEDLALQGIHRPLFLLGMLA